MMKNEIILACNELCKTYHQGPEQLDVLSNVNLSVMAGERVAIVGASGSGKSTLLNMLGGLDTSSSGEVVVVGESLSSLSESRRSRLRNRYLGFVYQFHHLLGEFSALENVAMPLLIRGESIEKINQDATDILTKVGLSERLNHKPSELSGGERQRVAIARALVAQPACVMMDEPTGNLDQATADSIHDLIFELNQQFATSFIIVTHDISLAAKMDRCLQLTNGTLVESQVIEGKVVDKQQAEFE